MKVQLVDAEMVRPLRHLVLRPGRPFADTLFSGDQDAETFHLAAQEKGEIIGVVSMMKEPMAGAPNSYRLRGMASHPSFRRGGIGRALTEAALAEARRRGVTHVWCHAREEASGFYSRLGFTQVGDRFDIPGIGPHFTMEIEVQKNVPMETK